MILALLTALISLSALIFMFSKKVQAIELGEIETDFGDMAVFRHVENGAEQVFEKSKSALKRFELAVYHVVLLALHKILPSYKTVSIRIEEKLVSFAHMVKGRRQLSERGSSSLFLRDIARHKRSVAPAIAPATATPLQEAPSDVPSEEPVAPKRRIRRVKVVTAPSEE